jgi:hypothetical protein
LIKFGIAKKYIYIIKTKNNFMPDFSVDDIQIEPYEYVSACGAGDIKELIKELEDEGYLKPNSSASDISDDTTNRKDVEYVDSLHHLKNKRHLLTRTEEDFIISLAERFKHL